MVAVTFSGRTRFVLFGAVSVHDCLKRCPAMPQRAFFSCPTARPDTAKEEKEAQGEEKEEGDNATCSGRRIQKALVMVLQDVLKYPVQRKKMIKCIVMLQHVCVDEIVLVHPGQSLYFRASADAAPACRLDVFFCSTCFSAHYLPRFWSCIKIDDQ